MPIKIVLQKENGRSLAAVFYDFGLARLLENSSKPKELQ